VADGALDVAMAASTDAVAADGVTVGQLSLPHARLRSGGTWRLPIRFQLPEFLSSANYTLIGTIDPNNVFTESNEDNNTAEGPAVPVDAQVHDVQVDRLIVRPTLAAGRPAAVAVQLGNAGNVLESGTVSVDVSAPAPVAGDAASFVQLASITPRIVLLPGWRRIVVVRFVVPKALSGLTDLTVSIQPITVQDGKASDNSGVAQTTIV
jgi:hypothetical protein